MQQEELDEGALRAHRLSVVHMYRLLLARMLPHMLRTLLL